MKKLFFILTLFFSLAGASQTLVFGVITSGTVAPSLDTDAQRFIDTLQATGVTLTTVQRNAIDTLVRDLKGLTNPGYTTANLWSKKLAIWPIIGGTAAAHKLNLKDPRNLDAAFRITFSGTITHSATGMAGDGSTGVGNLHITGTNLSLNSAHLSFYSRTNVSFSSNNGDMGAWNYPADGNFYLGERFINGDSYRGLNSVNIGPSTDNYNTQGYWEATRTAGTTMYLLKNGSIMHTDVTSATALPGNTLRILAWGDGSGDTPAFYSTRECAFASVGSTGLTTSEAAIEATIVNAYQTRLSRNVY
jgi:hypothetical protein